MEVLSARSSQPTSWAWPTTMRCDSGQGRLSKIQDKVGVSDTNDAHRCLGNSSRTSNKSPPRWSLGNVFMWELSIRDVRFTDAGLYECQLTTHPPASLFFWLRVVEARAVIRGGPAVHVPTGGRFTLHCTVHLATETPSYIFWFHNGTMVNFLSRRGLRVESLSHTSSVLRVSEVMWRDAGTYRCEPHRAVPANMTVHVVEGEKHAALHNGQKESSEQDSPAAGSGLTLTLSSSLIGSLCLLAVQWGGGFPSVNT
ncbi:uncharacterized protein LOC123515870 isoform X2 [Portunus trituberculatus]|uniref:uncharacterized protein LOC123515870 isoform X2 n=1 Tax=Portunus trituberculatus TaxID=210409 RepID=UPI001E1D1F7A|nr:uncharacterized protein LOC123515870 isoform X2 [Portunus trituberculatus]